MADGTLAVGDVKATAFAILAMLTGICTWYKPEGRLSVAALVALHTTWCCKAAVIPAPHGSPGGPHDGIRTRRLPHEAFTKNAGQ